ncbi:MAG: HAMP domain-containing protein, partial [Treponema sp.]|nr:HAMP domain-containing protein [Treponema sp.]
MKLRFRLTFIIALLTIVIIAAVSVILLNQARKMQTEVAYENMSNMSDAMAVRVQLQFEEAMNSVGSVSRIFNGFKSFDEEIRRPYFNQSMYAILAASVEMVSIYAVWKPGIIDSTEAEYNPVFTQEGGMIDYHDVSEWNAEEYTRCLKAIEEGDTTEIISEPFPFTYEEKNILAVLMATPIMDDSTEEIFGIIGAILDITNLQKAVESLKPYDAGIAALYSHGGIIAAHPDHSRIGKSFQEISRDFLGDEGIKLVEESLDIGKAHPFTYGGNIIVNAPFYVGGTKTPWVVLTSAPLNTVLDEVSQMRNFTFVFAFIMVVIASIIIFLIINFTVKPIVNVTLTLRDISEGEGDLTKTIPVTSKDEVGDLAQYF